MLLSSKKIFKETLESLSNDLLNTTHKALDDEGNPSMVMLFVMIVTHSNQQLDWKYCTLNVAKNLIVENMQLKNILTDTWKSKSFKAIQNISM